MTQKSIVKKNFNIPSENNIEAMRSISRVLGTLNHKLLKGVKTNKKKLIAWFRKNSKIHFLAKVARNTFGFIVSNYMACYLQSDLNVTGNRVKMRMNWPKLLSFRLSAMVLTKVNVVICLLFFHEQDCTT